jgi:hypothetical protein
MRYIFTIIFLSLSLFGANLNWSHNYKQGLKDAKKEHKLLYVLITSDSCRWCRKFENTTLQDKVILKRLYSEFVTIHLSRDRDEIPKKFKTAPIPRHYFTDAEGNILYNTLGHRGVECFDSFMDNAEEKFKINQKKEIKK